MLSAVRPFLSTDLDKISVVWFNSNEKSIQYQGIKDALLQGQQELIRQNRPANKRVGREGGTESNQKRITPLGEIRRRSDKV